MGKKKQRTFELSQQPQKMMGGGKNKSRPWKCQGEQGKEPQGDREKQERQGRQGDKTEIGAPGRTASENAQGTFLRTREKREEGGKASEKQEKRPSAITPLHPQKLTRGRHQGGSNPVWRKIEG